MSPQFQWQNSRPAFTVFYRQDDLGAHHAARGTTAGLLRAADANVMGQNGGACRPCRATAS
ncbi:MAG: hypothetical protein WKG07_23750 [Hymenobacter sp.]